MNQKKMIYLIKFMNTIFSTRIIPYFWWNEKIFDFAIIERLGNLGMQQLNSISKLKNNLLTKEPNNKNIY
jgi:hypothetical protein